MPQLLFRGVAEEDVAHVSRGLVDELVKIIECPREYFTLEHCPSSFFMDGQTVAGYPFVQVNWFDRGQEVRDRVAGEITRCLQKLGHDQVDVYFLKLDADSYYENGNHF